MTTVQQVKKTVEFEAELENKKNMSDRYDTRKDPER